MLRKEKTVNKADTGAHMTDLRGKLKDKKRIVIKIGSSSLIHEETGNLNFDKMERLVRVICDLCNQGKEVVLVSSGAIGVGRQALGMQDRPKELARKQACASVGQARLMMVYQRLFAEYGHIASQVLMTKHTVLDEPNSTNAKNTFNELLHLGVVPIVNENDTISTEEIEFGDNDRLSAVVTGLIGADLLILLSDIDALYTADPNTDPTAKPIPLVEKITEEILQTAGDSHTSFGTGGMTTKLSAALIACGMGADMVIANAARRDVIQDVIAGKDVGTLFVANPEHYTSVIDYLRTKRYLD